VPALILHILSVSRPSQVLRSVVGANSVVMGYLVKCGRFGPVERFGYENVNSHPLLAASD
jgi:hypothetical protein